MARADKESSVKTKSDRMTFFSFISGEIICSIDGGT